MAHKEPLPAWPFAKPKHVVRAVDRHSPQLRHARDHVDLLAVAPRRFPDVLQLERPFLPRKADIVGTGSDPHASCHPFVDNRLRRGQIGGLNFVVLGTANRRRKHFSSIHGDDEDVRRVVSFHACVAFLNTADQPARRRDLDAQRRPALDARARLIVLRQGRPGNPGNRKGEHRKPGQRYAHGFFPV